MGETLSTSVPPPGPEVERHRAAGAELRHFLRFSGRGEKGGPGADRRGALTLSTELGRSSISGTMQAAHLSVF